MAATCSTTATARATASRTTGASMSPTRTIRRRSRRARSTASTKLNTETQQTAVSWTVGDPTHEANWITSPHATIAGRTPLERWTPATKEPIARTATAATAAVAGRTRTVTVRDSYFSPSKLTVKSGTTMRWVWPTGLSYTHDVMLGGHPKGVKTFMSEYAAGDYSFKRKLTVPGTYTFMCELHESMTMKVVVKR